MDDPHNLNRFVEAQEADYERALSEIVDGHKRTHWMWYIFPARPDDLKLKSCATLFASVLPQGSVFDRLLAKYYAGARDGKTLRILDAAPKVGGPDQASA